jgi:hypothetical protein
MHDRVRYRVLVGHFFFDRNVKLKLLCGECGKEIQQRVKTRIPKFCSRPCAVFFRSPHKLGNRYGSRTLIEKQGKFFIMKCDCGSVTKHFASLFASGEYPKCAECTVTVRKIPEYQTWADMIQRCENKNTKYYNLYGGKGVSVDPIWRKSFKDFFEYIGSKPTKRHQIDRIDPNGNYEPGNVRWATPSENTRNRRGGIFVMFNGKRRPFADVLDEKKIPHRKGYAEASRRYNLDYQKYVDELK